MSLILPQSDTILSAGHHAFLHRVVAIDESAQEQSIKVNADGSISLDFLSGKVNNAIVGLDATGSYLEYKSLIAGTNITITNTPNGIQIDAVNDTTATWGSISGTLSNQTDLQNALNAKFTTPSGTTAQYIRGDGSIATFNTAAISALTGANISIFVNNAGYLTANQTITLSGEASGTGSTSISVTLANSAVIAKVLTGYVSGAGTISAADSILSAIQKLNGNISAAPSGSGSSGQITFWTGASTQSGSSSFIWDNSNTRLGIGIANPQSFFNASQAQYSTGTASQSGTTITGVGTTFTSSMIGSQFIFADGTSAGTITAFGSTTSLTVSVSQTKSSQAFAINYQGLRGNNNNWSIGGAPSGGVGPFFKVGGPTTTNTFAVTGSNVSPTIVAGFDSGTATDGDGSLGSYSNTTNSATSGAVRFFRANPSGAVTTGWVLGEIASYGGKTATTFTDRSASIRFVATEAHSASAAGTNITFSTVGNTTKTLSERMRILQDGNVSIGTTSSLSRLAVLNISADQARFLYDTSNYLKFTTNSSGYTTFDSISGNGAPGFNFNILSSTVTTNQNTWYFSNGNGIAGVTTGTNRSMYMVDTFRPTSGTTVYTGFEIAPTINQTGGANGATRGVYINPTFTAVGGTWRAIEANNPNSSFIVSDTDFGGNTNTPNIRIVRTASSGNTKVELIGAGTVLMSLIASSAGEQRIFTASGGSFLTMYSNGAEAARFDTSANFGIGIASSISARLHVVSTTEQSRLGYDATNYNSFTVGSTGNLTITSSNASGTLALRFGASGGQTIGAGTIASGNGQQIFTVQGGTANAGGVYSFSSAAPNASSGTQSIMSIAGTVSQTGTASYNGILLNVTEISTGSGTKLLADLQKGGTSQFSVDSTGAMRSVSNSIALASTTVQTNWFTFANGFTLVPSTGVTGVASGAMGLLAGISISPTSGSISNWKVGNLSTGFAPTSGTAVYNILELSTVINQTGGANGITRGLYINPTLTAAADFRAIEITAGNILMVGTSGNSLRWTNNATAPATNIGAAVVNYYGTSPTNFLGDPTKWILVNIGGTDYKVPAY